MKGDDGAVRAAWYQVMSQLRSRLTAQVNSLARPEPELTGGGLRILTKTQIVERRLAVVVEQVAMTKNQWLVFEAGRDYAATRGITMIVKSVR
ncbi:MAG: hypothetical protein M3P32_02760 [Chloroflexota bacterium]|nr:hypothetical protein [Chloroflexota bacterium]